MNVHCISTFTFQHRLYSSSVQREPTTGHFFEDSYNGSDNKAILITYCVDLLLQSTKFGGGGEQACNWSLDAADSPTSGPSSANMGSVAMQAGRHFSRPRTAESPRGEVNNTISMCSQCFLAKSTDNTLHRGQKGVSHSFFILKIPTSWNCC